MDTNVDIAIIGAGTSGMLAYKKVRNHTDSIALIEANEYGTTCARVGCMPSKLMIAAAEAVHNIDKAKEFGITTTARTINPEAVMKRIRDERDRFVNYVLEDVESFKKEHLFKSKARFLDSHLLELENGKQIKAKGIILAVGSRATVPGIFKGYKRVITSDAVFDWKRLPKSIAVIGSGLIGLELGQALTRLGVRTKIFSRTDVLGGISDPRVLKSAQDIFSQELALELNSKITELEESDECISVKYSNENSESSTEDFELVLLCTGRKSNLDSLQLENAGLSLDENSTTKFDPVTCQSAQPHIFIAGDANGVQPLLHEAADEGKIAGSNAVNYLKSGDVTTYKRSSPISIVFSDPQIMRVGQSYRDLDQAGIEYETGEVSFKNQGRARSFAVNQGQLCVYAEKNTHKLLGAEMVGPKAEHIAHLLAWSHQSELAIQDLLARPFYHPTIEEGLRSALKDLIR